MALPMNFIKIKELRHSVNGMKYCRSPGLSITGPEVDFRLYPFQAYNC
jgi:hypothetical protein